MNCGMFLVSVSSKVELIHGVVAHAGVALVNLKSMLLFSSFLLMLHILIHLLSAFIFIFILLVLVANLYAWLLLM